MILRLRKATSPTAWVFAHSCSSVLSNSTSASHLARLLKGYDSHIIIRERLEALTISAYGNVVLFCLARRSCACADWIQQGSYRSQHMSRSRGHTRSNMQVHTHARFNAHTHTHDMQVHARALFNTHQHPSAHCTRALASVLASSCKLLRRSVHSWQVLGMSSGSAACRSLAS